VLIEQRVIDTNAGKQLSWAATNAFLTLVLKKMMVLKKLTTFKCRLQLLPPDVSK
jgi:hypothetical protein